MRLQVPLQRQEHRDSTPHQRKCHRGRPQRKCTGRRGDGVRPVDAVYAHRGDVKVRVVVVRAVADDVVLVARPAAGFGEDGGRTGCIYGLERTMSAWEGKKGGKERTHHRRALCQK